MDIAKNFSLKPYNTFSIDVSARAFVIATDEDEMFEILSADELKPYPKFILGGGSNLLFTKDYEGLVVKNSVPGIEIIQEDESSAIVEAGAGVNWNELVNYCVDRNLGGIENLALIPGTVGAAPIQNIGAYGEELSETFHSLRGFYTDTVKPGIFYKGDCRFGYRSSIFKNELKNRFVVTKVQLMLNKNPEVRTGYGNIRDELEKTGKSSFSIKDVRDAVVKIRQEKLPDPAVIGNAGSFFKNPEIRREQYNLLKENFPDIKAYPMDNGNIKLPAAWLIDRAGWKGYRKGNTGTHIRQALVIVNYGNASGDEILHFAKEIKRSVYEKFEVILEEEVNII